MRYPQSALSSIIRGCAASLVVWLSLAAIPVHAASGVDICATNDEAQASLHVPVDKLGLKIADQNAEETDSNSDAALVNSIAVTRRKAQNPRLRDSVAEVAEASKPEAAADRQDLPGPDSRFPGVSDDQASRFRRQMYRTDI